MKRGVYLSLFALSATALALAGCTETTSAEGGLTVLLEGESSIVDGIDPGTGPEDIQDGWAVRFERYVIHAGPVTLTRTDDPAVTAEASESFVVDLTKIPASGLALWSFPELAEGAWEFGYAVGPVTENSERHESTEAAVFDELKASGGTYRITGSLARADGYSCPPAALALPGDRTANGMTNSRGDACYAQTEIGFDFRFQGPVRFGPCEVDGVPGIRVSAGESETVGATIHGDHLFFNGFPEGSEGGVMRLTQWLADADLNLDGEVTESELTSLAPADLAELDDRFQLGGSPVRPLNNLWEYLTTQTRTQGHFQGEGECPINL